LKKREGEAEDEAAEAAEATVAALALSGVGCYEGVSAKDSQPIQIFIECERRSAIVAEGSEVPEGTKF
jgi:hypothetical protein